MEKLLRKLARSNYWQILYARAQDIGSLRLFSNDGEYSKLQVEFLYWLQVYSNLNQKLYEGDELLIESYFDCDTSIDAYMYYRRKHKKEETIVKDTSSNSFSLIQKQGN